MLRFVYFSMIATVLCSVTAAQQENKTDAKRNAKSNSQQIQNEANLRDFRFQGEYEGTIGDEGKRFGMQVIALGNGRFQFVAFPGGLPGNGHEGDEHEKIDVLGKYDSNQDVVNLIGYRKGDASIRNGVMTISVNDNDNFGSLKKVIRQSTTLGAKPPKESVVLFDGTSTALWKKGRIEASEMVLDDGDGSSRKSSGSFLMQGTTSIEHFGDHSLHLEFRLPFMPDAKGQGRGNSGMYIQGRYEVQMLDSFGLEGKHNECGGIYSVKAPDLNMCYPPMSWQTYDVDFTAAKFDEDGKLKSPARVTVKHNGVVIHDDVELPNRKTTAAPVNVGPENGPLYLQDHRNQVRYRNIWAIKK